jgi:Zn-dependent protease
MELSAVQTFSVWILPVVFAITLHEAAHGFAALLLGDRTAKLMGRVSLNPIRHIDPVGTVLLPGIGALFGMPMIGWAKPVPVNFTALRHPRRDSVLVALAGPGTNILLGFVSMLLFYPALHLPAPFHDWALNNLQNSALFNVIIAVFNMLPIPPLDGGRVLTGLLPPSLAVHFARFERYGLAILFGLFFILPLLLTPFWTQYSPYEWVIWKPSLWIATAMATLLGLST